tara:strand:- start:2356 stop:3960 length:1605 start_codon:yes stop_codon:yes gene_type:complete
MNCFWRLNNMKFKILVTDPISNSGIEILKNNNCEIINKIDSRDSISEVIDQIDGWIIRSGTKISQDDIKAAKKLQVIGRAGVGVDNIDIKTATKHGVVVMNVPDGNSISAAEHTMAMVLGLSRNVHLGHITLGQGLWERANLVGNELRGKILGVVGLGRIGREVIERALSFGMKIFGYDPYVNQELFNNDNIKIVDIDELTKNSDIITLHVPLNDSTKNLFNLKRIKMMKKTSKIINVARGGIINELDLATALNNDIISGAGIDVFSNEPLSSENPLASAKNVLLTPHLGASTHEAKEGVSLSICQQTIDFLETSKLNNAINVPISDMTILKEIQPYLELSELIGNIQSQLIDDPVIKIEINCYGAINEIKPISIALIKGLLSNIVDNRINYINALSIADERGIELSNTFNPQIEKYANLIDSYVYTKNKTINVGGGVFFGDEFRILKFMNHEINFIPKGHIILSRNKDIPGVVGEVGSILGKSGVNIAEYILSRTDRKQDPISIIKVDNVIDADCLEKLNKIDEIIEVRQFKI